MDPCYVLYGHCIGALEHGQLYFGPTYVKYSRDQ